MVARAAAAVGAVDAIAREQIVPGGREHGALVVVRDTVQRFTLLAFLCGVTGPWRPGGARSSQPYLGPRGTGAGPGDMMMDGMSPACGDAAAQSDTMNKEESFWTAARSPPRSTGDRANG
jgi:hypothetical protein